MRKTSLARLVIGIGIILVSSLIAYSIDVRDTALLTQPAISAKAIAFVYANDLWTAGLDGRNVSRLTTDIGLETNPVFSPDGSLIAFSGQYDGNVDVYVVPASGGVPKRLTWHPGPDLVQGFTPDGSAVLFTSGRFSFTARHTQLFTVPVQGGFPERLQIPNAFRAVYSPDGTRLAYNPIYDAFLQWKHYRGGTVSTICIFDTRDNSIEKIPQPEGRANDPGPMWIGDKIYFRSDRNGEFNIYSYDTKTKVVARITDHKDFPVLSASAGAGKIIYEQAGRLHILDPDTGKSTAARHRCRGRPWRASGAIRQRKQVDPERRHLSLGRPGRLRVPGRDRHGAGREGRSAEPHQHARRPTSARPSGRPTASPSAISPTSPANTSSSSAPRTARARSRSTR